MEREKLIEAIMAMVLREAEERRTDAGYKDKWDDGGASILEAQVKFYKHGQRGEIPAEWKEHAHTVENKSDPEWAEYQRLHKKFHKET